MYTTADYVFAFALTAPFVAWLGWMVFVLPIQVAVDAYRHRGGRLPQSRSKRRSEKETGAREAEPQTAESAGQAAPSSADDGDDRARPYWVTGVYDPERYYRYSQQDLEIMRTFGMDGDSYDANWSSLGERD